MLANALAWMKQPAFAGQSTARRSGRVSGASARPTRPTTARRSEPMSKRSYTVEIRSAAIDDEVTDMLSERFGEAVLEDRTLAGPVGGADGILHALELRTSIDAVSAVRALEVAEAAFDRAARKAKIRTEIALASVWLDLESVDFPDELVNGGEVARRLKVSRQRVAQLVAERRFPRPVAQTERDRIWRWGDVAAWARLTERRVKVPRQRKTA